MHECQNKNRTKVKVRKWIDTPETGRYERFVMQWHNFLKAAEEKAEKAVDEAEIKKINMTVLQRFFMMPFVASDDFYGQFEKRVKEGMDY